MASMKAERVVGTQLFGQAKKETAIAKGGDGAAKAPASSAAKAPASKAAPKKAATKPQPPKKKGKGGKAAAKQYPNLPMKAHYKRKAYRK